MINVQVLSWASVIEMKQKQVDTHNFEKVDLPHSAWLTL